jgi:UDPglucose--hexose-1-phosphate uridylyltransferase
MRVRSLTLPDGRYLAYYDFGDNNWSVVTGNHPDVRRAPRIGVDRSSELRWNTLLNEWVVTATHRQERTFLPPTSQCPFCPSTISSGGEIDQPDYDIAVLENRFPSLQPNPGSPSVEQTGLFRVLRAQGVCEVVLYSPVHTLTLAEASVEQIYKLIQVWISRWSELRKLEFVKYVFIFENKGEAIGVTLHHPHGQIYAFPFVPPRIQTELDQSRNYSLRTGDCLICSTTAEERRTGARIITENASFCAYIPFAARWPYEVHIVTLRHCQALDDLWPAEQRDFALILKTVLSGYDRLFDLSFPYMMVLHQQPCTPDAYDFYHFHLEFYPPMRSATRLKYLAGSETGAGMFINDSLPEAKAAELRAKIRPAAWNHAE